ncbi:MAG: dihydropteroate synthase [Candidatus Omnitrophica bacterium]|nr:dihydropteroate synthase [Candidatus Omnitrophota bacterium]
MGVLNVTPDSFSDGGRFFDREKAVARGLEMLKEGADIIDIGGESTRPGAEPVSLDEELNRVLPVIKGLAPVIDIPISVDTSKPSAAEEAIKAGASMINNVMGTPLDSRMAEIAARYEVPIVLMHIKGLPRTMQKNPAYEDLIGEIIEALKGSIAIARGSGVAGDKIIIDPGIGFGKTVSHNLEIVRRLSEFKALGYPLLVGVSRKSFIGAITGIDDPLARLMGSAAAAAACAFNGADIVRVHDVKETAEFFAVWNRIFKS